MRERRKKRMMFNWKVKYEVQLLWEKKDHHHDDLLRSDIWVAIFISEKEGWKEWYSIEN
jgi:hypothetical protein